MTLPKMQAFIGSQKEVAGYALDDGVLRYKRTAQEWAIHGGEHNAVEEARDSSTSSERLDWLADDFWWHAQWLVAIHPNTSRSTLQRLSTARNRAVHSRARKRLADLL
jgi:hypothetical protein